jgi:hypothetical protein
VQCSSASGDVARMSGQRHVRAAYGRARRTRIVGYASALIANQVKRWGLITDDDGYFFELSGETLSVVRRSSITGAPVETRVANAQWNGQSDAVSTLYTHVYEICECWPNGDVWFFVDGELVHTMSTAGAIIGAGTKTARLPLCVEARNTASTSAGSFYLVEGTVYVEEHAFQSAVRGAVGSASAVDATGQALLAIRPKSSVYDSEIQAVRLDVATNGDTLVQVYQGATIVGGAWADVDALSLAQQNTTTVALPSDGVLASAVVCNSERTIDLGRLLTPTVLFDSGVKDTLLVVAKNLSSGNLKVRVCLSWKEVR